MPGPAISPPVFGCPPFTRSVRPNDSRVTVEGVALLDLTWTLTGQGLTDPISATAIRSVAASSDDGREGVGISPGLVDEKIQMGSGNGEHLGIRFTDFPIQHGAEIPWTTVSLTLSDSSKNDAEGTWFAHDIDDAPTFTTTDGDMDGRAKTTASVAWNTNDLGVSGDRITTPNLASLIQEVVNRPGWQPGNNIALLFVQSGTTDKLQFGAYDDPVIEAPSIRVEYRLIPQVVGVALLDLTWTLSAAGEVVGGISTAATPGTLTLNPVAVGQTPGPVSTAATAGTLTLNPVAVTPVPGPVTTATTSGALTLTPVAVGQTPGPVSVAATPGILTLEPVPASLPGGLVAETGVLTLTPVSVTPVPGPVTTAATPGTLTLTPVPVTATPGPVSTAATAGTVTLTPIAATPVPGSVTTAIVAGTLTLEPVAVFIGDLPIPSGRPLLASAGSHRVTVTERDHSLLVLAGTHVVEVP